MILSTDTKANEIQDKSIPQATCDNSQKSVLSIKIVHLYETSLKAARFNSKFKRIKRNPSLVKN